MNILSLLFRLLFGSPPPRQASVKVVRPDGRTSSVNVPLGERGAWDRLVEKLKYSRPPWQGAPPDRADRLREGARPPSLRKRTGDKPDATDCRETVEVRAQRVGRELEPEASREPGQA